MNTCSTSEISRSWLAEVLLIGDDANALPSPQLLPPRPRKGMPFQSLDVTPTAARAFPLAKQFVAWVEALRGGKLLAWVFEWGIWESCEDWHLYYLWREAKHDFATIEDRPGHVFLPHERHDCETLAFMAICFGWGLRRVVHVESRHPEILRDDGAERARRALEGGDG